MNIISNPPLHTNGLSFQKKLKARCHIVQDGFNVPCRIYELEKGKDENYFEKLIFHRDWQNSRYIMKADDAINDDNNKDVFVLENENKKCLGFCVTNDYKDGKNLEYIETIPKQKAKNKKRNMRYIGETLIAFLASTYKDKDFYIKSVLQDAMPFYESCNFKYSDDEDYDYKIDENEKRGVIRINEAHTSEPLELFA